MEPAIIPYVESHAGAKRVLELTCLRGLIAGASVEVSIDGRAYPLAWGTSWFEIPADRPVSVTVVRRFKGGVDQAHVVLTPELAPVLDCRGPAHLSKPGDIGQPRVPGRSKTRAHECPVDPNYVCTSAWSAGRTR